MSFNEVIAIASIPSRALQLRSSKSLSWYWLATALYFLYGETVIYYFKHIVLVDKVLLPLATHHRFISAVLYVFGGFPPFALPGSFPLTSHARVSLGISNTPQASSSSSPPSRPATTSSSSPSSPGPTWPSTSSSSRPTSS